MVRYLSLDWIDALRTEVADNDHMREIAETHRIGVTQVVTDGPEGDAARDSLSRAIAQSRDRLCTVSRTVQLGADVTYDQV